MVKPEETSQIETPPYANASPSKYFFCEMLTRDIELKDAIMDLVDNCIDGAMRVRKANSLNDTNNFYAGFFIDITINNETFKIEDNCGGIPLELAENYAFKFGRPKELNTGENNIPTIGLYGIGMKRAIFKIGESAEIYTKTEDDPEYKVEIPNGWIDSDEWRFKISRTEDKPEILKEFGTSISIVLKKTIPDFSLKGISFFIEELRKSISQSFGLIIQKGLIIKINGKPIEGVEIAFLVSNGREKKSRYLPYIYTSKINGVDIFMIIGFYKKNIIPSEDDIEAELKGDGKKRSSEDAGWTVICNDRVVLYNNKDHLTGWGDIGVPKYHTQFIGIKGIVKFTSNDPSLLPTTTSKRGIDLNSEIYSIVKKRMCLALKKFTDYTNKWKGMGEKEREKSSKSDLKPALELTGDIKSIEKNLNVTFTKNQRPEIGEAESYILIPDLPIPQDKTMVTRISYFCDNEEYEKVAKYLFGCCIENTTPTEVGLECFNIILKKADGEEK